MEAKKEHGCNIKRGLPISGSPLVERECMMFSNSFYY